jgi:hypothetical protein
MRPLAPGKGSGGVRPLVGSAGGGSGGVRPLAPGKGSGGVRPLEGSRAAGSSDVRPLAPGKGSGGVGSAGGGSGGVRPLWNTPPPQDWLVTAAFDGLDGLRRGRLWWDDLGRFARLMGFRGTAESWWTRYLEKCERTRCPPEEGLDLNAWRTVTACLSSERMCELVTTIHSDTWRAQFPNDWQWQRELWVPPLARAPPSESEDEGAPAVACPPERLRPHPPAGPPPAALLAGRAEAAVALPPRTRREGGGLAPRARWWPAGLARPRRRRREGGSAGAGAPERVIHRPNSKKRRELREQRASGGDTEQPRWRRGRAPEQPTEGAPAPWSPETVPSPCSPVTVASSSPALEGQETWDV